MVENIIQLLYYSLFLFTPLVMSSVTSELFEFNKIMLIYTITVLIGLFWVIKMIVNKKLLIKRTPFDIPILLFLISQVLSTVFSIDVHTSIFGYYGRFNGGLLSIITYIILFYGFISNFSGQQMKKVLKVSLFSSFLVILWGLPGKFGHDLSCLIFTGQFNNSCWTEQFHPETRMFSTLGQPNWLGAYLSINFFLALYLIRDLIFNYFYLFLNFSAILFTRSRSALASVIFGLLIFFVIFRKKYLNKKGLILAVIFLAAILIFKTGISKIDDILTLKFIQKGKSNVVVSTNQPPSDVTESFDIRKIVWKGALDLGFKYPFFGTGVETFAYSYYFVRPAAHNLTSEWDFIYNKAHNEYLNYLATTGFVGLITYLLLIISVLVFLLKKVLDKNEDKYFFICLFLAYLSILITNFFGFSTTTINLFFFLIPALAALPKTNNSEISSEFGKLERSQWVYFSIVAAVALLSTIYLARYYLADIEYARADVYSRSSDYQSSVNHLNSALNLRYEHVYEDKLSYTLASLAVIASYQKQDKIASRLIDIANFYNQKSLKASPKNVLYWKTKAKNEYLFYQITLSKNNLQNGIQALDKAFKLSPTDPKIPYSLAIFSSLMADETKQVKEKNNLRDQSIQQINESIKLKKNYRDAYLLKGQLLKKYGDREGARLAWQYILDKINLKDTEVKKELEGL